MKRWMWMVGLFVAAAPQWAFAEPISFEQAGNVTGMAGIEIGADFDYAYEKIAGNSGTAEQEVVVSDIPVFIRLGIPVLEAKLTIPYGNVKTNVAAAEEENYSGIRDVGLMVKTGLLGLPVFSLAAGVAAQFPTGDPKKYLGEGLDFNPFVAADIDMMVMKLHGHLGYEYRGEFNREQPVSINPSTGETEYEPVKVKPGDAMHWALGVEIPTGDLLFLQAELIGTSYGDVKVEGEALKDSAGATISFVPGVRLQQGPLKAKVGYAIPLEREEDRPQMAPRSDWRILAGVSLLFGI